MSRDRNPFRLELERIHQQGVARLANSDPDDDADGAALLLKAASGGLPEAQYDLAVAYERGQGVQLDFSKEVEWLERAAEHGLANAQFKLAHCYRTGKGVAVDPKRAFYWYRTAAAQGDAEAQNNVATAYVRGDGVKADLAAAAIWYERALSNGYATAALSLARIALEGPVQSRDYLAAEKWILIISPSQDDLPPIPKSELRAFRREAEDHLDARQRALAEALAARWLHDHLRRAGTTTPSRAP